MKIYLENVDTKKRELIQDLHEDIQIYQLKSLIKIRLSIRIDSIELLTIKNIRMEDCMSLKFYQIKDKDILGIRIEKNIVKLLIEIFQKDLEKMVLKISTCASVFMIKFIIQNETKIDLREQVLYMDNRILEDREHISDLQSNFFNEKDFKSKSFDVSIDDTESSSPRFLKLKLLTKQSGNKFKLGLDFSFNYLKSLKKINWDEEAPSFREISDGVCLICYCQNMNCDICNQMFVKNLGLGKFEIIEEISNIICGRCFGKNIDVKNLGFVNCEWIYKGILKHKSGSRISGEGKTMDRKLHTFKEVNIYNLFEKLYISVNEYEPKEMPVNDISKECSSEIKKKEYDTSSHAVSESCNDNMEEKNQIIINEILNPQKTDKNTKDSVCLIF